MASQLARHPLLIAIAWIGATHCCGCGERVQREQTHPVHGVIRINGEPAARANVYFHPRQPIAGANPVPFATVEADGSYRPTTFNGHDGLPAGQYRVTVVWRRFVEYDGQQIASDDRLQGKYSNPERPVATVTIHSGDNEIPPLDLKP